MKTLVHSLLALFVVLTAMPVLGQALQASEETRLHLVLDPDGRVRLSSHVSDHYIAPPLRQARLPRINPYAPTVGSASALRMDIRTRSGVEDGITPCLAYDAIRLMSSAGCESLQYGALPGIVSASEIDMRLESANGAGMSLSFGLSWLEPLPADIVLVAPTVASSLLFPAQFQPGLDGEPIRTERFAIAGFVPLGDRGLRLDLGYQYHRGLNPDIQPGLSPWLLSHQDSLSLGLSYGRFHGGLIGRQHRPLNPLQGHGNESLDLGFSWRMPWWNAELEFGARNLLTRPSKPDPVERPLEQGDLRTPYLRYYQEL